MSMKRLFNKLPQPLFQFLSNSYTNSLKAEKNKPYVKLVKKEIKITLIKYTSAQQLFSKFSISTWGELVINFLVSDWLAVHNTLLSLVNYSA